MQNWRLARRRRAISAQETHSPWDVSTYVGVARNIIKGGETPVFQIRNVLCYKHDVSIFTIEHIGGGQFSFLLLVAHSVLPQIRNVRLGYRSGFCRMPSTLRYSKKHSLFLTTPIRRGQSRKINFTPRRPIRKGAWGFKSKRGRPLHDPTS